MTVLKKRRGFSPDYDISYMITYKDGSTVSYLDESCYGILMDEYAISDIKRITLYNILCEDTKEYHEFYLNFLIDTFKLKNVEIDDDEFSFDIVTSENRRRSYLNLLLVLTSIRYLWEGNYLREHLKFFEYIKQRNRKGISKLKLLMEAWGKLDMPYYNGLHQFCDPVLIKPKSMRQLKIFEKRRGEISVKAFCTSE